MDYLEENREWLSRFHMEIWNYAEPAFREYKSAAAYVKLLREDGQLRRVAERCPLPSAQYGAKESQ